MIYDYKESDKLKKYVDEWKKIKNNLQFNESDKELKND